VSDGLGFIGGFAVAVGIAHLLVKRIQFFVMCAGGAEEVGFVPRLFPGTFLSRGRWRGDVEGDELGDEQAADDDQAQGRRPAPSAPKPNAMGCAHDGGERGHDDRAETVHAGVVNACSAVWPSAMRWEREVDDHDAFFLTMPMSMNIPM